MYLPRHHQLELRGKSHFTRNLFLTLFALGLVGFAFWKRNDIKSYFISSALQKQTKLENKAIESVLSGKPSKEVLQEFITSARTTLQSQPTSSRAYHSVAKSYYYEMIASGFILNLRKIHELALDKRETKNDFQDFGNLLDEMYLCSLKARALPNNFPELHSNQMLISLYEMLEGRKIPSQIFKDIESIELEKISPEIRPIYVWLFLAGAASSGQKSRIEKSASLNELLVEPLRLKFTNRDLEFLKGIASFKEKNYIESLQSLRIIKKETDYLSREATKLEAEIFFQQNLPEKAITLLENLYYETESKDTEIIEIIKRIIQAKPKAKSKLSVL
ncbi:MAG: hypothetical protein SFU98_18390 [Leptospiraceae bacterium]|nr:hypothetical protein [Leptospiraceae bacterium]